MLKVFALLALSLMAAPAAAVSCGRSISVTHAYSAAQDVFSARVERIYPSPGFSRENFQFAQLRVLEVWKGSLHRGDTVTTTAEESVNFVSDGFVPLQGSNVLVYSHGEQPLILGSCSRTSMLESTHDLRALERLSSKNRENNFP
ncbi:hypothetical protein [Xanthomonas sp. WHRI 8932A]|uniref:hypothetical protein n=1 Tax=unclassified Xanthomonas TaxID=2643310 RepID=UPI002B224B6F|nr:hypothetical protein [Xanthomonas sp. WHRI 8932A]MEA9566270.1 hypothetical protein [Xanthomonas sp. WHRI 8932A]